VLFARLAADRDTAVVFAWFHGKPLVRPGPKSFGGTLDGVALPIGSHGGGDDFGGCARLALEFDAEFSGSSTFVIEDDSMTVTAEFSPDAFEPHVPILRSPANWQFSPGETVRVGWSHPADLEMIPVEAFRVYFHTGKNENNNSFDFAVEYAGDEILFTVPDPPPVAGAGFIVFQFGYSNGTATRCTGATSCQFSSTRGYQHTVVIAN
jgi:hypothetical protein